MSKMFFDKEAFRHVFVTTMAIDVAKEILEKSGADKRTTQFITSCMKIMCNHGMPPENSLSATTEILEALKQEGGTK